MDEREMQLLTEDKRLMSQALAAILNYWGIDHAIVNGYYIYKTADGGADAFPVDVNGERIRLPEWKGE